MKNHSQTLVITLAASITMALALVVALICISYIEDEPPRSPTEQTGSFTETVPPPTSGDMDGESESGQTIPFPSNGLRFTSNGDGSCVLSGIGSCTESCVVIPEYASSGERVTAISAMALYGCTTVSAVQIPASVQTIGNLAFSACPNLAYISVSEGNPCYRDVDGVLYTADLSTLLLYPPMRAGVQMTVGVSTTEIRDMAFYGCAYLTRIVYTGTAEEWELIRIGSKNYSLTAASVTFDG